MKHNIITVVWITALVLGSLLFIQNVNFNRLGADVYYTQIQGQGKKMTHRLDNGETLVRYDYELPAFDKKGSQITLPFTADKQLREKAYLSLYVKEGKGVTSYQEVTKEELPELVNEKLQEKKE